MTIKKIAIVCLIGFVVDQGRADVVIYNNIASNGSAGGYGFNSTTTGIGQKITTTVGGYINYIQLNLFRNYSTATSETFSVQLWKTNGTNGSSGNSPASTNYDSGARLATLYNGNVSSLQTNTTGTNTLPNGIAPLTISSSDFTGQYQLVANTTYWLVVMSNADPNIDLMWGWGPSKVNTNSNSLTDNYGFIWQPKNFTYDMGALVSVPEPGTFILASIAFVSGGAGVFFNRRKKPKLM